MAKAPQSAEPQAPAQPLCTGCTQYAAGQCPLLLNVLASDPQAVVSSCTHYDSPSVTEEAPS